MNGPNQQQVGAPPIDAITLEVLNGRFHTIAEEMELTLLKSSYSTVITEAQDTTAGVFDTQGRTIAQAESIPAHLGVLVEMMRRVALAFPVGVVTDGDIYISNDPYDGGTHLPDVLVAAPVFFGEHFVGYVASMSHHMDVGGVSPGSVTPEAVDIYAEGIRIPLMRLCVNDELNEDLIQLLVTNSRKGRHLRGDLEAQIAACKRGRAGMRAVVERYGLEMVNSGIEALFDYAETITRSAISRLPDGDYTFRDFIDDDGFKMEPIPIQVRLTVSGSDLGFDFEGTGPQTRGAINSVPSSTLSMVYYAVRALIGTEAPNNDGCYRPVSVNLPPGTVVNPDFPAPVAVRTITLKRVIDVVFGALAQAAPDSVYAACHGQSNFTYIGGFDPLQDAYYVGFLGGPIFGGMGARPTKDGIDVTDTDLSNIYHVPVEVTESEIPVRLEHVRLWQDSGGAGQYRGGLGYQTEVTWLRGWAWVTLKRDRHTFGPWGLQGGKGGPMCRTVLVRASGEETELKSKEGTIRIEAGDTLKFWTTGSGGFGNPLNRSPESVLEDVLEGRVSRVRASEDYGVVIEDGRIDVEATKRRRTELTLETKIKSSDHPYQVGPVLDCPPDTPPIFPPASGS